MAKLRHDNSSTVGPGDLAPSGFEPLSPAPKASMLGHYTTGLHAGTGGGY